MNFFVNRNLNREITLCLLSYTHRDSVERVKRPYPIYTGESKADGQKILKSLDLTSLEAINKSTHHPENEVNKWGFSLSQSWNRNHLFVAGGLTDEKENHVCDRAYLWTLSIEDGVAGPGGTLQLDTVCSISSGTPINCSSTFDRTNSFIYLFGGQSDVRREGAYSNRLHKFDIAKKTWSEVSLPTEAGKNIPKPRSSSYLTSTDTQLFLFGGTDGRQTFVDLHSFDLSSMTWTKVDLLGSVPKGLRGLREPPIGYEPPSFRPLVARQGKLLHYLHEDFESGRYSHCQIDLTTFQWKHINGKQTKHPKLRHGADLLLHKCSLNLVGGRDVMTSSKPKAIRLQLNKKAFSWTKERVLWLACYKNSPEECLLAKCPPMIIYKILTYLNSKT